MCATSCSMCDMLGWVGKLWHRIRPPKPTGPYPDMLPRIVLEIRKQRHRTDELWTVFPIAHVGPMDEGRIAHCREAIRLTGQAPAAELQSFNAMQDAWSVLAVRPAVEVASGKPGPTLLVEHIAPLDLWSRDTVVDAWWQETDLRPTSPAEAREFDPKTGP